MLILITNCWLFKANSCVSIIVHRLTSSIRCILIDDVSQQDDGPNDDDTDEQEREHPTISAIEQHEICHCGA